MSQAFDQLKRLVHVASTCIAAGRYPNADETAVIKDAVGQLHLHFNPDALATAAEVVEQATAPAADPPPAVVMTPPVHTPAMPPSPGPPPASQVAPPQAPPSPPVPDAWKPPAA